MKLLCVCVCERLRVSHCRQVLAQSWSLDCWAFLCLIVGSLPYIIKHLEATSLCISKLCVGSDWKMT